MDLAVKNARALALKSDSKKSIDVFTTRLEPGIISLEIELRIERMIENELSVEKITVLRAVGIVHIRDKIRAFDRVDYRGICWRKRAERVGIGIQFDESIGEEKPC